MQQTVRRGIVGLGTAGSGVIRMLPEKDIESQYYLRFMGFDRPGVLARITGILSKYGVSIASVHQDESHGQPGVPILIVTHSAKAAALRIER